jgi:MinD superfamily P-loop ATPase
MVNMNIAVTGGKGGTGKSTVATALAVELAKKHRVLLADVDVDCPDDHLLLSVSLEQAKKVEKPFPFVNKEKCVSCGKCSEACRANAIVQVKNKPPIIVEEVCTGCMACQIVCPVNAITRQKRLMGVIKTGKNHGVELVTGEMIPGERESVAVVNGVKKSVQEKQQDYDFIIFDTAAGSHCPVISAIDGCTVALAVTEPTPLGVHDLNVILNVTRELGVKAKTVLNKAGIADDSEIKRTANEHDAQVIAELPYSKKILEKYSRGEPVEHDAIKKIAVFIESLKEESK